jgi:hypothetical protein
MGMKEEIVHSQEYIPSPNSLLSPKYAFGERTTRGMAKLAKKELNKY